MEKESTKYLERLIKLKDALSSIMLLTSEGAKFKEEARYCAASAIVQDLWECLSDEQMRKQTGDVLEWNYTTPRREV